MPLPTDVEDAAERLSRIYGDALHHVRSELASIADETRLAAQQRRLRALASTLETRLREVDTQARQWVDRDLPRVYERGLGDFVSQTAAVTGATVENVQIDFTMPSRPAVERLAADLTDDLLKATKFVTNDTKRAIRSAVRSASLAKVVEGKSLLDARRAAQRHLEGLGIGSVRYANGARMPLDAYAHMAVRTTTASAYNGGMLDAGRANGVEFFEVFDGPSCGWLNHDDGDKAGGSIRSREDCDAHPVAHPHCRRSFGPRPDLNRAEEAKPTTESTPATPPAPPAPPKLPERVTFEPKGLHPTVAQQLERQVAGYLEEYPAVAEQFDYLGTTMGARRFYASRERGFRPGRTPPRTYAEAIGGRRFIGRDPATGESQYRIQTGTLGIAQRWGSKPNELRTSIAEDEAKGWHPKGTGNIEGLIAHEFGHHIFYMAKADAAILRELEEVLERLAREAGKPRITYMKENLSRYATKNNDEMMAEAFAEWKVSPEPRPLARGLGEVLDRHYKKP